MVYTNKIRIYRIHKYKEYIMHIIKVKGAYPWYAKLFYVVCCLLVVKKILSILNFENVIFK